MCLNLEQRPANLTLPLLNPHIVGYKATARNSCLVVCLLSQGMYGVRCTCVCSCSHNRMDYGLGSLHSALQTYMSMK